MNHVKPANHAVGGTWKNGMAEVGNGTKIPDLWRMSALLATCPKDVREHLLLRLDEVGEARWTSAMCTALAKKREVQEMSTMCEGLRGVSIVARVIFSRGIVD